MLLRPYYHTGLKAAIHESVNILNDHLSNMSGYANFTTAVARESIMGMITQELHHGCELLRRAKVMYDGHVIMDHPVSELQTAITRTTGALNPDG